MNTQIRQWHPDAPGTQPQTINRKEKGTMKTQIRIASLFVLTLLCLATAAVPASASNIKDLYDNGAIYGDIYGNSDGALTINSGYAVSNSFGLTWGSGVTGFEYGIWAYPLDGVQHDQGLSVDWTISSQMGGGGTVFGSGTATIGGNGLQGTLSTQFLSVNAYGYDIELEKVTGLWVPLAPGNNYWLTLQNASMASGNPVFWDENNGGQYPGGGGCGGADGHGQYCPSSAEQYYNGGDLGPVPSESFTINGVTPEPSSLALFGSGVLGLAGLFRRRFLK